MKLPPLWQRLYYEACYVEIARIVGYSGLAFRDLMDRLESLHKRFGSTEVESAVYHIVTYEGQMTSNPKPLAEVKLRPEVRRLCFQLLGPAPEQMEAFLTNPDGSSRDPKQARAIRHETPPKEKPVTNEPPAKKARKKKPEPENSTEKPTVANRPAADDFLVMDQYRAAKEKHPDMMLLFRIGDFYEMFEQDAEEANKLLGLTLTTRDQTQMAGFPHHCLESYLHKLLKAGKRVAVCDQVEDSSARGPIKREVQRIVIPENDGE